MRLSILFLFSFLLFQTSFSQSWQIKSPLPENAGGRHHPVTFGIGEYGYVMVGSGNQGELNDAYKYHGPTDTWTEMEQFPGLARGFSIGAASEGKGYLGFGIGREGNGPAIYLNDLWEFDPVDESWRELASCPCRGRSHPAFVATKDKIFVGLGNDTMGNMKDWWEYDKETDTWSQKPFFPNARRHHPYHFEIDGLVYVAFGHGDIIYKDLHSYDPVTEEWTVLARLPDQGRVAGAQFSYNGKGYVLSGDDDQHSNLPSGEMWSYDPSTDEWTQETSHPGPGRWAPGAFVIGDEVFFTGGENLILWNDLLSYNLAGDVASTDNLDETLVQIAPNPSKGIFVLSDAELVDSYEILDSRGQVISNKPTLTDSRLDLTEFSTGLYYLVLNIDSKKEVKKLIVTN